MPTDKNPLTERVSGRLKEEIGVLFKNEVLYSDGKQEALIARLRREYGLSEEEAHQQLKNFLDA